MIFAVIGVLVFAYLLIAFVGTFFLAIPFIGNIILRIFGWIIGFVFFAPFIFLMTLVKNRRLRHQDSKK
ncbi:hypothetical protein [Liquorilactobacillus hordei]|uniref:hypothetical protein n=1 Tax=Liquorilactobacillus hordei TaxID=468911 RepID=UPI001CBB6EE0|nr:hypothetical protein [Liquorilactobacillus hordei]MBZ2406625.1 hypothetical protein [Liquorilactobacillus hordei]